MYKFFLFLVVLLQPGCGPSKKSSAGNGWISIFDGQSLKGWQANENPQTFTVENGAIKVAGVRSHLFYVGDVMNHNFKNFELKARVMTKANSNSGIYFHTTFQEKGFPDNGFEVQVNNSHKDWKRTGSLYDISEVGQVYVKDDEWFTQHITVKGKKVVVKINGKKVMEWIQPDGYTPADNHPGRIIAQGTFALQGHDPGSTVFFKDIQVKNLPD